MIHENVSNRLKKEWTEHGRLIVAYDFDNTVFDFHGEGHCYDEVVELLRECKEIGAFLIVFTAAGSERYPFIEQYLKEKDIPYDAINENMPGLPFSSGNSKVYYNVLLDDRAGLSSAMMSLQSAIHYMKRKKRKGEL